MATAKKPRVQITRGRPIETGEAIDALRRAERKVGDARKQLSPSGEGLGGGILDKLKGELAELRQDLATGKRTIKGNRVLNRP